MTMPRPSPRKGAVIELEQDDLNSEVIIHKNLTQDVLVTTEDKMKLTLIEYREILASRNEWLGAGTLTLSFPVFVAADQFQGYRAAQGQHLAGCLFHIFPAGAGKIHQCAVQDVCQPQEGQHRLCDKKD